MNGMTPRSSFGGYPEINGYSQQQYYSNGIKPQIYTVSSGLTPSAAAALPTDGRRLLERELILLY
jgi:hypothetical protein